MKAGDNSLARRKKEVCGAYIIDTLVRPLTDTQETGVADQCRVIAVIKPVSVEEQSLMESLGEDGRS